MSTVLAFLALFLLWAFLALIAAFSFSQAIRWARSTADATDRLAAGVWIVAALAFVRTLNQISWWS